MYKYKPIPEVLQYKKTHYFCEITGRTPAVVHHIDHNRRNNDENNLFSLCLEKHTGDDGVHLVNELKWIIKHHLQTNPKWINRYEKLKSKQEYLKQIEEIYKK